MSRPQVGKVGIWSAELRFGDSGEIPEAAAELEELGYSGLWLPGTFGGDIFGAVRRVLDATRDVTVATGIVNVWAHTPVQTAAAHAELTAAHPGRFLLGLGISHQALVDGFKLGTYDKPLTTMRTYLDGLDAAAQPVPDDERCLAALKPRMRQLAAQRTAGTHSYFVTPDHTRAARETMGAQALVAPEQTVVAIADPEQARDVARRFMAMYLTLPNYTNNLKDHGFTDEDLADGGSDRIVDAVVAWGTPEQIRARVQKHLDAGADHVCLQVVTEDFSMERVMSGETLPLPRETWRELAPVMLG